MPGGPGASTVVEASVTSPSVPTVPNWLTMSPATPAAWGDAMLAGHLSRVDEATPTLAAYRSAWRRVADQPGHHRHT